MRETIPEANRLIGSVSSHDVSVPMARIPAFLVEADAAMAALDPTLRINCFGHLGDGNLHFILDGHQPAPVLRAVYALTATLGGAITAEHGIGLDKVEFLPLCRPLAEIAAMRALKSALDPAHILNPGRIFG